MGGVVAHTDSFGNLNDTGPLMTQLQYPKTFASLK